MRFRPFVRTPVVVLAAAVGFVFARPAFAETDTSLEDATPVLLSTDGSGPKWKTLGQLKQFAAKGDPLACFQLAELLIDDSGGPQDTKKAAEYFEQAARGGIANGWFRLGKIYHDGLLAAPDYGRALDYFTLAARAGVAEAQHNIGAMLVSARGVRRNYVEGLAWLIVSSKSGVGQEAEEQVRGRLAKKPRDIQAAEARAVAILADLAHAEVPGVLNAKRETVKAPEFTPKKLARPSSTTPPMEKPVISINPTAPFSLPVAPTLGEPVPPKDKR